MKNSKSWIQVICFLIFSPLAHAQMENLHISGTTYQDTVKFVVQNTGSQAVPIGYVIIQDQVLMLTAGQGTVPGENSLVIKLHSSNASDHAYAIEVYKDTSDRSAAPDSRYSIGRVAMKNRTQVYPNPAKDQLFIDHLPVGAETTCDLQMFDMRGALVNSYAGISGPSFSIPRGDLPAGTYFLRISTAELSEGQLVVFE